MLGIGSFQKLEKLVLAEFCNRIECSNLEENSFPDFRLGKTAEIATARKFLSEVHLSKSTKIISQLRHPLVGKHYIEYGIQGDQMNISRAIN